MLQNVDGRQVFVVCLPENFQTLVPFTDSEDPTLTPYADALTAAVVEGIVTKPGKYAIEISESNWTVYNIDE